MILQENERRRSCRSVVVMMDMVIVVQVATAVLVNMMVPVMATITQIIHTHRWRVVTLRPIVVIVVVVAAACGSDHTNNDA